MNPEYLTYNPNDKKHTISYVLISDAGDGVVVAEKRFTPNSKGQVGNNTYDKDGNLVDTEVYLEKAARRIWDELVRTGYTRGDSIRNLPKHVDDYLKEYMEILDVKKDIHENDLQEMRIDPKEYWKKWKKTLKEDYENYALNA